MEQAIMALASATRHVPGVVPETTRTLLDLADQLRNGELKPAPHQRDTNAWTQKKRYAWIQRNREYAEGKAQPPLGTVCIYEVISEGCRSQYLNEGLQRISAANDALAKPDLYGFVDRDDVMAVLRRSHIHVHGRRYANHLDAAKDFQEVNNGTTLEPEERNRHVLVYSPQWNTWAPEIERWSDNLERRFASFCATATRRGASKEKYRCYLQLFSVSVIGTPTQFGPDNSLERAVVESFTHTTPSCVNKLIKTANDFIAEIEDAWRIIKPHHAELMQEGLARWCLGVLLLNRHLSPAIRREFLCRLLDKTQGKAKILPDDIAGHDITLGKRLNSFHRVAKILGLDVEPSPKRIRGSSVLKPGYHADHILPFADFGEGPTKPLPARLNAAKNARRTLP